VLKGERGGEEDTINLLGDGLAYTIRYPSTLTTISQEYERVGGRRMNINLTNVAIEPLFALLIGILILLVPSFLNYFVAVYLIVVGILGLVPR
jgi:hypothetical protein